MVEQARLVKGEQLGNLGNEIIGDACKPEDRDGPVPNGCSGSLDGEFDVGHLGCPSVPSVVGSFSCFHPFHATQKAMPQPSLHTAAQLLSLRRHWHQLLGQLCRLCFPKL